MPVRCLTATPCTIDAAQAASLRLGQSSYKRFLDLSCNIDKTLFLGNNAPCRYYALFDRISSLNCFKIAPRSRKRRYVFQNHLFLVKNDVFALCFALFLFLSFLPKKCVFGAKNALFRSLFCVCCVLQKTAPKRAVFVFLCLFVFVCDDLFNESLQRKHR